MFKLKDKVTEEEKQIYSIRENNGRIEFLVYSYRRGEFRWVDSSYYEPLDDPGIEVRVRGIEE